MPHVPPHPVTHGLPAISIHVHYYRLILALTHHSLPPDDPKVPIALLIYAVQTAVTTITCIADYMSWSDFSATEKLELGKLYMPYLALCKSSIVLPSRGRYD